METSVTSRLSLTCRSAKDDLSDTFTNVIGAISMAVTIRAIVYAM